MVIYVDIDNTICETIGSDYLKSEPIYENIEKINKLFDEGHTIIYWTARGRNSKTDHHELTILQLNTWGCKYSTVISNEKPAYDLLICDKTKRIEEI